MFLIKTSTEKIKNDAIQMHDEAIANVSCEDSNNMLVTINKSVKLFWRSLEHINRNFMNSIVRSKTLLSRFDRCRIRMFLLRKGFIQQIYGKSTLRNCIFAFHLRHQRNANYAEFAFSTDKLRMPESLTNVENHTIISRDRFYSPSFIVAIFLMQEMTCPVLFWFPYRSFNVT